MDVNDAEAKDRYVRGLKAEVKRLVIVTNPSSFQEAALRAEQIASAGSTRTAPPMPAPLAP